ncbi:MAG: hypothetical protein LBH81_02440 [Rickettsiales bacterium]|jgi:hypothetical protein|nr:hypothetical protein [Rickettsiales bacterium]
MAIIINLEDDYIAILKNLLVERFGIDGAALANDFEHIIFSFREIMRDKELIRLNNPMIALDGTPMEDVKRMIHLRKTLNNVREFVCERYKGEKEDIHVSLVNYDYNIFVKVDGDGEDFLFNTMTMNLPPKVANVYIDESGHKGYSHKLSTENEKKISVFAGVVVPAASEKQIMELFRPLFEKFKAGMPTNMKLHITDAFGSEDENVKKLAREVRDGYLEIFKQNQGIVLFGAKRAAIEKRSFDTMKGLLAKSASTINPDLHVNEPYPKETLEGKAFMSMHGKMEAFAQDFEFDEVVPLLDEIDEGKKEEYEGLMDEFRNINGEKIINTTAWDKVNKKVIKRGGKISFSVKGLHHTENRVSDINVVGKDNPLILLADILANYIHNYMIGLPEEASLHAPSSYIGFDLYENKNLYGLTDNWLDDKI